MRLGDKISELLPSVFACFQHIANLRFRDMR
jgi:hypothetical protein